MANEVKLWRYYIPSQKLEGWAIFVLGSDGYFSAVSDYGNYAFLWTHHGCKDFREFLLRADRDWDYFANKLSDGNRVYDGENTIKRIRERISEKFNSGEITEAGVKTQLWLIEHEYSVEDFEDDFRRWCEDRMNCIEEPWEMRCEDFDVQLKAFVKKAMVRLIPLLKKDLEAEYGKSLSSVQ